MVRTLDAKLDTVCKLEVPQYPEGSEPIYMSFVVHHRDRQKQRHLRSRGVDTTTGYMNDMANHELFLSFLRVVQMLKKQMLNFFIYPCIRIYL